MNPTELVTKLKENISLSPIIIAKIWQIRASTPIDHWVANYVTNQWYLDPESQKGHLSLPYNIVRNFDFVRDDHLDEQDQALLDGHTQLLIDFLNKANNEAFLRKCSEALGSFTEEDLSDLNPSALFGSLKRDKQRLTSAETKDYFQFFCELKMAEKWLQLLCEDADSDFWGNRINIPKKDLFDGINQRLDWLAEKNVELKNLIENLFFVSLIYNPLLLLSVDAEYSYSFLEKLGLKTPEEGRLPMEENKAGYAVRKPLTDEEFQFLQHQASQLFSPVS